jgi:hypothetical protein
MAAAMILMGHVIPEDALRAELQADQYNPDRCLLSDWTNFVSLECGSSALETLQGCYLMHFESKGFIYSGKVGNRPFKDRRVEHQAKACKSAETKLQGGKQRPLYYLFPSRRTYTGPIFEDLKFLAGLSFSVRDPHRSLFCTDMTGIFQWDDRVLDEINRRHWRRTLKEKQVDFVAYYCELAYRLALSQWVNLDTSSTGFERILKRIY